MRRKCVIWGINYFAEMLSDYVEKYADIDIEAFVIDQNYRSSDIIYGKPLVAFEEVDKNYPPNEYSMIIAVGYRKMNNLRKSVFVKAKEKGYRIQNFIHPNANLESRDIGEGNIIFENVNVGYKVKIGDGNILWNGVNISHHGNIGNFNFFAPSAVLAGCVNVRDQNFIGTNATIKGGLSVGERTLIGAGCYISKSTEDEGVYVPHKSHRLEGKNAMELL